MPLHHFLLIYNATEGQLLGCHNLGTDGAAAADAYSEAEGEYRDKKGIEIILVGADSIETIKITHSHYFEGADEDLLAELTLA